jgi:hypothetical protein
MTTQKDAHRLDGKLVILPVALVLCCALPTLIAAGVIAGIGAWIGAHARWAVAGPAFAVVAALFLVRSIVRRRRVAAGREET